MYNDVACSFFIAVKNKQTDPDIPKHIIDKAQDIMKNGDPVKFLFETHQKEHIGDEIISKTLIVGVGVQSVNNAGGIQPKLDGTSGKGKSHSAKAFMKFIPQSHKIEGSCSDKVLYYQTDMRDGTVVYSDDIDLSDDMVSTIKRATTNYQEETTHYTLNKDRTPEKHSLPKRIMWLLTSVENNQSVQLLNRQFGGSVDESIQQDESVFQYQVLNDMLGRAEFSDSDDVLICREIIRDIKTKLFTVVIPFEYLIEWKNKDNRRNFTMFTDMIKGFAVYRYKQRKVEDNYLFADLQDFDEAEMLYNQRKVNQRTKLTDTELKICNYLASVESADTKTIQEATGISNVRISQLMKGKQDSDTGLLCKVSGLSVESVSADKEIGEMGRKKNDSSMEVISSGKTHKNIYSLSGFNYNDFKESVVSIGDIERSEFSQINLTLTSDLLFRITHGSLTLTKLNNYLYIHSKEKLNQSLIYVLFGKEVNLVNLRQPIVNNLVNLIPHINPDKVNLTKSVTESDFKKSPILEKLRKIAVDNLGIPKTGTSKQIIENYTEGLFNLANNAGISITINESRNTILSLMNESGVS